MTDPTPTSPAPGTAAGGAADAETHRRLAELAREAWSQALVTVGAAEEEVQKLLARVQGLVEMGPEEARRVAGELSEKLHRQRAELESSVEQAVRKALAPFRLPTREQIAAIDARLDQLEERIEKLMQQRGRA